MHEKLHSMTNPLDELFPLAALSPITSDSEVLRELIPRTKGWTNVRIPDEIRAIRFVSAWQRGAIRVISSLSDMEWPDGRGVGPTWLVSVTRRGRRPTNSDTYWALRAFFGKTDRPEEDNHHPGNARCFFLPVDPAHRVECQCKQTEDVITGPDGYKWTNPKPGQGACRGCEIAPLVKRPCPIHGGES